MPANDCFSGLIAGYPEVAVDRFDGRCLNARFFLLSHLHSDHMRGLASPEFLSVLAAQPEPRLFLSRQSAALLSSWPRYAALKPYLCPMEVNEPRQLTSRLVVTPLPAAHCPGSVMFLLEAGVGGAVLYTGDFRLGRSQLEEMRALHDEDGRPKPVDVLYADTTFCVPQRRELPTRGRSADCVLRLVNEWLHRGPNHRVNLECKARYGYEHMFRLLHEKTGMRVHVDAEKSRLYECLPDISRCVTSSPSETRLHSCRPGFSTCLRANAGGPLRTITLSTMFFFLDQDVDRLEYHLGGERYRVLYSFHASLSQVQEMVTYLRPRRVVPCVVPMGGSLEGVLALLDCRSSNQQEEEPGALPRSDRPLLLLGDEWKRPPALLGDEWKRPPALLGEGWERRPDRPTWDVRQDNQPADDREPLKELKRPRMEPQSPQQSPQRPHSRQKFTLASSVSPSEQVGGAVADTRPAWKSPFDSD